MALQNILDAIKTDVDNRIASAQTQQKQQIKLLREAQQKRVQSKKQTLEMQKEHKKKQMKERALSHARMMRSKKILSRNQELMDQFYGQVLDTLKKLPKDKAELFLKNALEKVQGTGTIHAAETQEAMLKKLMPTSMKFGQNIKAAGGFRFVSEKTEQDFTYEFIVENVLRPKTEVQTAEILFQAKGK